MNISDEHLNKLLLDTIFHKKGSMLSKAATFILCIVTVILIILLHISSGKLEKLQIDLKIKENNAAMYQNNWFACEGILKGCPRE